MRKRYNLLIKNDFFRNSFTLISGTSFSIFIQILASPVLTRIYSPAEFGAFALFFSVVTFLSVIITAKYELTIILPKEDAESAALVLISMVTSFIFSMIILCGSVIVIFMEITNYGLWLYFVPLVCLFIGFFQSGYYWLIRKKKFRILSVAKILQSLVTMTLSVLFAFILYGYWGLILGYVIGQIVASLFVFAIVVGEIKVYWVRVNMSVLFKLIKRYKNFPLYLNFAGLVENFAAQLPTFLLSAFFGKAVVGFYSLAQRVTRVPISVISASVGDVFRQRASFEYTSKGECRKIFVKIFLVLITLASIPFIVFFIIAPGLFNLVFGVEWMIAGEYARILTAMLFLQFVVSPLSNMFVIAEKQKIDFVMQVYLIVVSFLSLWCGYYFFHSVKMSLLLFTIVYSTKYLFELVMSYRFSLGAKIV
jgi:O-antigen/teichoic acid export membrane protein